MSQLNITIENTKCGLGDMLHRIDTVYRFCKKHDHGFYMPDVASNLHGNKYDETLGIDKYKPNKGDWHGVVEVVGMKEFIGGLDSHEPNKLYSIKFDHSFSKGFFEDQLLHNEPRLDYTPYVSILRVDVKRGIDVLIHLRLGDRYIYTLGNGLFFHSRSRKILHKNDLNESEFDNQWTVNDVKRIIEHCEQNNLSYKIHCDGTKSVYRFIRWTKDDEILAYKNEIEEQVRSHENNMLKLCLDNPDFVYDSPDIELVIKDMIGSKLLVHTVGGFATGINKLLNPEPCKKIHIKKYLSEVLDSK